MVNTAIRVLASGLRTFIVEPLMIFIAALTIETRLGSKRVKYAFPVPMLLVVFLFPVINVGIGRIMILAPRLVGDSLGDLLKSPDEYDLIVGIILWVFVYVMLLAILEGLRNITLQILYRSPATATIDTAGVERHVYGCAPIREDIRSQNVLKNGRVNFILFAEGLMRDPWFALVGIYTLYEQFWRTHPDVARIIVAGIVSEMVVMVIMNNMLDPLSRKQQKRETRLETLTATIFQTHPAAHCNGAHGMHTYYRRMHTYTATLNRVMVVRTLLENARTLVTAVFTVLTMVVLARLAREQRISIVDYVNLVMVAGMIRAPFRGMYDLGSNYLVWRQSIEFIDNMVDGRLLKSAKQLSERATPGDPLPIPHPGALQLAFNFEAPS